MARADYRWMEERPVQGKAVDLDECPYRGTLCRCAYCVICKFGKHTAIHGPHYGEPAGSEPFGHEFKERE